MAAPDESTPTPARADQLPEQGTIEIIFGDSIDRADIGGLCANARDRLKAAADADRIICDVGSILTPDAVLVDALARLQLTARRQGRVMCLRNASRELLDLVYLMGLSANMPLNPRSRSRRGRGQSEEREQGRSVEEETDPGDPAT